MDIDFVYIKFTQINQKELLFSYIQGLKIKSSPKCLNFIMNRDTVMHWITY